MKVAVTGGRGFIGEKLVEALVARGDRVRILTRRRNVENRPGVEIINGDLTSPATDLSEFLDDAEVLYHCAGEVNDARLMREVHVHGTQRLIDAARGRIARWVQLSSVGAYGPVRFGEITEACGEAPVGEYEITKTEADTLVRSAGASGDFSTAILRPSIVYGPTMTNQSLFQLIGAVQRGWFLFIGKEGASANYIHVDNVVQALLCCGDKPEAEGRTYIVSDYCILEQFIAMIATALGRPVPRLRLPETAVRGALKLGKFIPKFPLTESRIKALTNFARYSDERIRRELDYNPTVSMKAGIGEMVDQWHCRSKNSGQ
jgi:nucleoside-diphosphate-sugar epimerase